MKTLIVISIMLITLFSWSVLTAASHASHVQMGKTEVTKLTAESRPEEINISKDNGYFAYMARPEWLVVGSDTGDIDMEIHLPRIDAISEVTWSQGNRYLTFTAKDRELWLFDLQHVSIRLLEAVPSSHPKVKYLPQWSSSQHWLLFVSRKNTQSQPRVYSPEKEHSYALPLSANEASSIDWAEKSNVIIVSNFIGKVQHITSFNAFGITIEQVSNKNLTVLNN